MKLKIEMPIVVDAIPAGKRARKLMIMKRTVEAEVPEVPRQSMVPHARLRISHDLALDAGLWQVGEKSRDGQLCSMDGELYTPEMKLSGSYIGLERGMFNTMSDIYRISKQMGRTGRCDDYHPIDIARCIADHGARRLGTMRFQEISDVHCKDADLGAVAEECARKLSGLVVAGDVLYRKVGTPYISVAIGTGGVDIGLEYRSPDELFNANVRTRDTRFVRFFALDDYEAAKDLAQDIAQELGKPVYSAVEDMEVFNRDLSVFDDYHFNLLLVAKRMMVQFDRVFGRKLPSESVIETPSQVVDDLRCLASAMSASTQSEPDVLAEAIDRCLQNDHADRYFFNPDAPDYVRMLNEYEGREIKVGGRMALGGL